VLVRLVSLAALIAISGTIQAQYPVKPVTLVVAFPAGSDADLSARNLAQHAQKYLSGHPVVVVNRPGASGAIGTLSVRNAPADGYTLLTSRIATHAILPATDSKTPYKWYEFTMLSLLEFNPYVCVAKGDGPYDSMSALIAGIRKDPGKLNFSTAGVGTLQNLGPQYLFSLVGLPKDAAVGIHYKGSSDLTTSLLSGEVQFACNNLGTLLPHIKSRALRALMTTMRERLPELGDVPTARALGWPQMEKLVAWSALMGPPGLSKDATERWTDTLGRLARDPDWLAGNENIGGIPATRSPEETRKFVREQYEFYEKLATSLGIRE
jgi:tripartite-type tricarboxylate transporter receptor subunit TctC